MKKPITVIIIVGALVGAGIIAYLLWRKKNPVTVSSTELDPDEDPIAIIEGDDPSEEEVALETTPTRLDWIENQSVKSYLLFLLTPTQQRTLKTWANQIDQEKIANPDAWKNANGLGGQVSDIGHSLYQMKVWNDDILAQLISKQ